MDWLNAALEKLSDGERLVHEYAILCQLKKAGARRGQDMLHDSLHLEGRHDGNGMSTHCVIVR
jgi:hypothetical protein